MRFLILALALNIACRPSPPANPEFDDAARFVLTSFDAEPQVLAFALRDIEEQVYLSVDVEDGGVVDRAVALSKLTEADLAGIEHPGRNIDDAAPVALASLSPYTPEQHQYIQFLADHTPVEPFSPDRYDREFEQGDECWEDQGCDRMETYNRLVKTNLAVDLYYEFHKHFRWVDMNLPDPDQVAEGEVAVNDGEPRWAFVARSWTADEYRDGGDAILQSYTIDMWIPRDGNGFQRGPDSVNQDDGDWTTDSNGPGSLRMLALWHETEVNGEIRDGTTSEALTRAGIQDNMDAADDWIEDSLEE